MLTAVRVLPRLGHSVFPADTAASVPA